MRGGEIAMRFTRALRRASATRCCADDELPALPDEVEKRKSTERSLEVDGETVTLDELGPIVVSKDGKLGHLSNWHEMTESEQAAALNSLRHRDGGRGVFGRSPPDSTGCTALCSFSKSE